MVQTTSAIVTCYEGWYILCSHSTIGVHQRRISVKVVIGMTTCFGHFRRGNLLVTTGCLISVITSSGRILLGIVTEVLNRLVEIVTISFDHTTILTRERTRTFSISTLQRGEDRLLSLQEVVVLHEDTGTCRCTYAILSDIVEIVVPYMNTHRTNTRMTRV